MEGKHPGGRPRKYETPEQMQVVIDEYFKGCEGEVATTADGTAVLDKWGNPVVIGGKPPTVTGLALALGFNSRLALLYYQDKDEFHNTVTRAKARVEAYAEARLFDRDGANGAKFSLANNFKNWADKKEVSAEITGSITNTVSDDDLDARIQALLDAGQDV